jgi:hypothetical protein
VQGFFQEGLFYLPVNALEVFHHLGIAKPQDAQALALEANLS